MTLAAQEAVWLSRASRHAADHCHFIFYLGWYLRHLQDLALILSTIIWMGSCHHAAVNFGQYDYG